MEHCQNTGFIDLNPSSCSNCLPSTHSNRDRVPDDYEESEVVLLVVLSDDEGDLDEQQEPILVTEIVEILDSNLIMINNSQQDTANNDQENIDCDYIQPTIDNRSEPRAILAQVSQPRFRLKKNGKKLKELKNTELWKTLQTIFWSDVSNLNKNWYEYFSTLGKANKDNSAEPFQRNWVVNFDNRQLTFLSMICQAEKNFPQALFNQVLPFNNEGNNKQ